MPNKKTKDLIIQLSFLWDEGPDTVRFRLTVPDTLSTEDVEKKLKGTHDYLCEEEDENEETYYGANGRNPESLLQYICEENEGWSFSELSYDIDLELD